jgi:hypothetical protein
MNANKKASRTLAFKEPTVAVNLPQKIQKLARKSRLNLELACFLTFLI